MHSCSFFPMIYIVPEYAQGWRRDQGRPLENIRWSDWREMCMPGCQGVIPSGKGALIDHHAWRSRLISE